MDTSKPTLIMATPGVDELPVSVPEIKTEMTDRRQLQVPGPALDIKTEVTDREELHLPVTEGPSKMPPRTERDLPVTSSGIVKVEVSGNHLQSTAGKKAMNSSNTIVPCESTAVKHNLVTNQSSGNANHLVLENANHLVLEKRNHSALNLSDSLDTSNKRVLRRRKHKDIATVLKSVEEVDANRCEKMDLSEKRGTKQVHHVRTVGEVVAAKFYTCEDCSQEFLQLADLKQHQLIHSGEMPKTTDASVRGLTRHADLEKQQLLHSGDDCGKEATEKLLTTDKQYRCDECSKSFTRRSHLKRHLVIHSGNKPYSCEECGKSFTQHCNLKQHQLIHDPDDQFSGSDGGNLSTDRGDLDQHQRVGVKKRYSCDECGKRFSHQCHLKRHQIIHTGEMQHCCDQCGKMFNQRSNLNHHMLIHSDEKHFSCRECGKKFTARCHLQRHQVVHTGDKPYLCSDCGMRFTQRVHLQQHQLIHSGLREFCCSICNKSFNKSSTLKNHQLTHFEREHGCDQCGKRFTLRFSLKKHKRTKHATNKE